MNRKICVVTGTRAEYGLLSWVMNDIIEYSGLTLQLIVTGMHLSPEFGMTYREIESDGFAIDRKVEILLSSDTSTGIGKAMGLAMIGFADALDQLQPDIVLVLGDRFEIFSAVAAATVANIPVAHIHGGESTEGAIDESFRHAISKMSHIHFVAADEYKSRVVQLGENPRSVYKVGGLGIDGIVRTNLLDRAELEQRLGYKLGPKNLLVTFHPVTLEKFSMFEQMNELLMALETLDDCQIIFTLPNADSEGRVIIDLIRKFVEENENAHAHTSLGQLVYLSCVKQVDGVLGNSSSGIIEAPYLHTATINIGDRQKGRLKASSIVDCPPEKSAIVQAIHKIYSRSFLKNLENTVNLYGSGNASEKIVKSLANLSLKNILKKRFYDISIS